MPSTVGKAIRTRGKGMRGVGLTGVALVVASVVSSCAIGGGAMKTPELLVQLPDICPTPDGMAMDADGNIILACPNFADESHPAVLMRIDPENNVRLLAMAPPHPETGVCRPMGITFGPEGHLYVVDNQGWGVSADDAERNIRINKGRILRMHMKDGRPTGQTTVIATGMAHPNGIRIQGRKIYVTQSLLVAKPNEPLVSGLYRFALDDTDVQVNNRLDDANLIAIFKTLNLACAYGADGLVFDSQGHLFVANFGDATLHKLTFNADGKVVSNKRFARDERMKSIDGICVDERDNIYAADFSANAICVISPEGKVSVLARSPDCDGSQGGLDQPGEPIVRGREVIVSNFDNVTGDDKVNTGHDHPYTMSVIDLKK